MGQSFENIRARWHSFKYNYAWPNYIWLFNSWLAKAALAVPILGYLILFNDTISDHLKFEDLSSKNPAWSLISPEWRLRLLYFGTILLGLSNLLYFVRRPYPMKMGASLDEYITSMLDQASPSDYLQLHGTIRHEGHYTLHGKYYDSDWENFYTEAVGSGKTPREFVPSNVRWSDARSSHEQLLRSILIETYFRETRKRRIALTICVICGFVGILFLFIPSLDLFVRVISSIFN